MTESTVEDVEDQMTERVEKPKESILKRRYTRRAALGLGVGAAAAGVGLLAAKKFGLLGGSPEEPAAQIETKTPTIYDNLREKLRGSASSEAAAVVERLDTIERSEARLAQIKAAYEAAKDEGGKPLLLTLLDQRYGKLRFSPSEVAANNRRGYLEEKIPFLLDLSRIGFFKKELGTLSDQSDPAAKINEFYENYEKRKGLVVPEQLPVKQVALNFDLGDLAPDFIYDKSPLAKYLTPAQIQEKVKLLVPTIPLMGKYEIRFNSRFKNTQFRSDLPGETSIIEIKPTETEGLFEKRFYHEIVHSLDPFVNYQRLGLHLKPQELVNLMIAREKATLDPRLGRTFPEIEKIFSKERDKLWSGLLDERYSPKLSETEFAAQISQYADTVWVAQTEFNTGVAKPLFDEYLATPMFNQIKEELWRRDQKSIQEGFAAFWQRVQPERERLAASDPIWKVVLPRLEKYKDYFNEDLWLDIPITDGIFSAGTARWWRDMLYKARAVVAEGCFAGDAEIRSLFSQQKLGEIERGLIRIIDRAHDELYADGVSYSAVLKKQTEDIKPNPYLESQKLLKVA